MKNRLKMLVISLMMVAMPLGMVGVGTVSAQTTAAPTTSSGGASVAANVCSGANLEFVPGGTGSADCSSGDATDTVNSLVTQIINIFSWVIGVVAVIMIIYAGFKYITSGGEGGGVKSAKDTILYAIIGLEVVVLAQTIVKFVLGNV